MGCSICWMGWLKSRAQNSILVPPERQGPKYLSRPLPSLRMHNSRKLHWEQGSWDLSWALIHVGHIASGNVTKVPNTHPKKAFIWEKCNHFYVQVRESEWEERERKLFPFPGTQCGSPTCVPGTQVLELQPPAYQVAHWQEAGREVE